MFWRCISFLWCTTLLQYSQGLGICGIWCHSNTLYGIEKGPQYAKVWYIWSVGTSAFLHFEPLSDSQIQLTTFSSSSSKSRQKYDIQPYIQKANKTRCQNELKELVRQTHENESGQMVSEKVKWAFNLMCIYHKQCEIMQKIRWNSSKANFTDFPLTDGAAVEQQCLCKWLQKIYSKRKSISARQPAWK